MKKFLFLFSIIFAFCISNTFAKKVYNLNNGWSFGDRIEDLNYFKPIVLPHVWTTTNISNGQYYRELKVLPEWKDKVIYIKFYGVANVANLFVNSRFVGEHSGAGTSFIFDISPYLIEGANNTLVLDVKNNYDFGYLPFSNDYFNYGGVTRNVELLVCEKEHIAANTFGSDGIFVKQKEITESLANFDVVINVNAMPGDTVKVNTLVMEGDRMVARSSDFAHIQFDGSSELIVPFKLENPHLWNAKKDPFCYTLIVSVFDAQNKITDKQTERFGLRNIYVDAKEGFYLNEEKYPIHGVVYNADKFGIGNGYSKWDYEQDFEKILELGATAIRTSPAPLDDYFYELCDKYGLIVWCDFPLMSDETHKYNGYVNSYKLISNAEKQMQEMLHQLGNHPSIAMWGIFNKISSRGDSPFGIIDKLNNIAKDFSKDKYTVATSVEDGKMNYITDLIGWGQYFGWTSKYINDFDKWIQGFDNSWLELKPALSDFGSEAIAQHGDYTAEKYQYGANIIPEEGQNNFHISYFGTLNKNNRFWGYFVNSMFDYKLSRTESNGDNKYNYSGLISYDRSTKKDAFYFYKANWNKDERTVYIANRRKNFEVGSNNTITVFSSCELIELKVNGSSMGIKQTENGKVCFSGIELIAGKNSVEAIGDKSIEDSIIIKTINNF